MNVYVRELSRALAADGMTIDVFTRRQTRDEPDVVPDVPGVRVVYLDAGPRRSLDKYDVLDYLPEFACGVQRWRALTGARYDLLHNHYWLSGRLAALFRDRWQVPLVASFHTLAPLKDRVAEIAGEREQDVRYEIERRTMLAADRVVAATEVDRAQILTHYGSLAPVSVIPGGVNLTLFQPRSQAAARHELGLREEHVLLFVGRLQRLKGPELLLRAAHDLKRRQPDLSLRTVIVGGSAPGAEGGSTPDVRELGRLRRLAERLGIAEQVTFAGPVDQANLPRYYQAADTTVMPSSYESFGLVAVESLACGTPVVATRVGGLTTIVRDGDNGFLVPWRNASLFADRLLDLLSRPDLRARFAVAARPSVQRFSWREVALAHASLYDELLAARQNVAAARSR